MNNVIDLFEFQLNALYKSHDASPEEIAALNAIKEETLSKYRAILEKEDNDTDLLHEMFIDLLSSKFKYEIAKIRYFKKMV